MTRPTMAGKGSVVIGSLGWAAFETTFQHPDSMRNSCTMPKPHGCSQVQGWFFMLERFTKFLRFGLVAALGALLFAGLAQVLLWLIPTSEPEPDCRPTAMVLALDRSLSMNEPPNLNKLRLVQEAVGSFVARALAAPCLDEMSFGLVTFNRQAELVIAPTGELGRFKDAVDSVEAIGGTEIDRGVDLAAETLGADALRDSHKVVLLLTDADLFDADPARLRSSLEAAIAAGIDVLAVVTDTEGGEGFAVLTDVLGERVTRVDETELGEEFFRRAQEVSDSIFEPGKPAPPLQRYLRAGLFVGLVTAGITLALLVYLNRYNKRNRFLSGREFLAVLLALGFGFVVGAVMQMVFSLEAVSRTLSGEGGFFRAHAQDFLVWTIVGVLLAAGLAGLRILPNLRVGRALLLGLVGGLVAGLVFALTSELVRSLPILSSLLGAAALGGAIGFAVNILSETGARFPMWLRVYYTHDRVSRYHPLGSTPLIVGSGREADIFVRGDHAKMLAFSTDGRNVTIDNLVSGKIRSLSFEQASRRGAIELTGVNLEVVDDVGTEVGRPIPP